MHDRARSKPPPDTDWRPAGSKPPHGLQTGLRRLWPWSGESTGLVCISCSYDTTGDPAAAATDNGLRLPPRLQRASTRRRAEFTAGRRCAGEALRLLSGRPCYPGLTEDGAPDWPQPVTGSISHSDGLAVSVAGLKKSYRNIGVDVERLLTPADAAEVAMMVLTRCEADRFTGLTQVEATTLAFSLKESLFKALYPETRTFSPFEVARIVSCAPDGTASLQLVIDLSPKWRLGRMFRARWVVFQDFVLTLICVKDRRSAPRPDAVRLP